jgi:hypothetical protein
MAQTGLGHTAGAADTLLRSREIRGIAGLDGAFGLAKLPATLICH